MSILHRNAIITGCFDSFCLLCEVHLTENVEDHTDVPEHKKNLKQSRYFKKYEKHHIRKVKQGYYCELCNILMTIFEQVGVHVSTINHEKNLGKSLLKQVAEGIIAFDQLFISNKAWNEIVEDSCFLCNKEFNDRSEHLKTVSHILNLIQREVQLKEHEIFYWNVDGTILHCLICNNIFGINDNESHVESDQHLKNIRYSCDLKHALDLKKEQHTTTTNVEKGVKKDDAVKNPFQAKKEVKLLAKTNQITFTFGKQISHCTVCNVNISSSLKKIKEHVEEIDHETKLQTKQNKTEKSIEQIENYLDFFYNVQKYKSLCDHLFMKSTSVNEFEEDKIIQIPTEKYLKTVAECSTLFEIYPKYVILNHQFCIKYLSLLMMTQNYQVIRCQACNVKVSPFEVVHHRHRLHHTLEMSKTPVVISLKNEFVRKIRNKIYHCGFCNLMVGNWKDLTMHLETIEHISEKKKFRELFLRLSRYATKF